MIILVILTSLGFAFAQTTATDFTTNDCDGTPHTLFDELDNGDVIVICWVMPCAPCATYAEYAADAVQSFATSHPGRVKYYLADDYANSTCSYLSGWAANYNIITDAIFSDALLDMGDYGTDGMPKAVVLGKNNHKIYYNKNDNKINQAGVTAAITLALAETTVGINESSSTRFALKAFPNPTNGIINLSFNTNTVSQFEIIDVLGEIVLIHNTTEYTNTIIDVSNLDKGNYILRMYNQSDVSSLKITITK